MRQFLLPTLLALAVLTARATPADDELAHYEKLLKDASAPTDGPELIKYLRDRTMSDRDRDRLKDLVPKLGARQFRVREQAFTDLVRAGRASLPALRANEDHADLEIRTRVRRAIADIERIPHSDLMSAVARVLGARKAEGTLAALLDYLPSAVEDTVEEAFAEAVAAVGLKNGQAEAAVVAALADREPSRRAAAALTVGRCRPVAARQLTPLLSDPAPAVRFRAAEALVRGHSKEGVAGLIDLLGEGPLPLGWRAEELLSRIMGDQAVPASLGKGDAEARTACRKAWEQWWKASEAKVNLAAVAFEETLRGLTVIAELDGTGKNGAGRVWECGRDGKPRWEVHDVNRPSDGHALPGGRVLVAEHSGNRVTERDLDGKVVWQHATRSSPVSCQRLPNGNTFIATYNEVLEVTRDGKEIYCHKATRMIFSGQKLRDGRIVYVHSQNGAIELDAAGKEVATIPAGSTSGWGSAERLANGRYLIAQYSGGKVTEVDTTGKVYWEVMVNSPGYATRLPGGNTLVASIEGKFVAEYDRTGKEVWRQNTPGRPFRAHRR